jgi:hypothetical protein
MSKSEKTLRQQLLEARQNLLRQIDICSNNPVSNFWTAQAGEAPAPTPVADLMATLKKIEDALADLDKDEA